MNHKQYDNSLSLWDIDELLEPVTQIDFDNQNKFLLWHLHGELELITHLVEMHLSDETTERRNEAMTNTENATPKLTLVEEDFGSFNALENVSEGYRPQIDPETRRILRELAYDLMGLSDALEHEEYGINPDTWFSAKVPFSVLCEVLQDVFPPIADKARILGEKPMAEQANLQPRNSYLYRPGDFTRALREGLRHENIVDDIEEIMFGLLFHRDDDSVVMARDLLFDLVRAVDKAE